MGSLDPSLVLLLYIYIYTYVYFQRKLNLVSSRTETKTEGFAVGEASNVCNMLPPYRVLPAYHLSDACVYVCLFIFVCMLSIKGARKTLADESFDTIFRSIYV